MPDVTVFVNCDTRLAINLNKFKLSPDDEFIFVIKNYSYIDSPCVFTHTATVMDVDVNGEIMFKITPAASKLIKPGAFYNFAVLSNAYNSTKPTEYRKLTGNGKINLEYGAHDITDNDEGVVSVDDIIDIRLEQIDENDNSVSDNYFIGNISDIRLERIEG
jgi:hypothetical protein